MGMEELYCDQSEIKDSKKQEQFLKQKKNSYKRRYS